MGSVKNSRCDMKKRRALLGGAIRWSIKRKKNYLHISYRSICGDQSRLRQSDAYLRIYSILKTSPNKGHDPNPWFSGINFFSGLALWSLQIKKRSLMGCLFFDADFSTFFILADKISRFAKSWLPKC